MYDVTPSGAVHVTLTVLEVTGPTARSIGPGPATAGGGSTTGGVSVVVSEVPEPSELAGGVSVEVGDGGGVPPVVVSEVMAGPSS